MCEVKGSKGNHQKLLLRTLNNHFLFLALYMTLLSALPTRKKEGKGWFDVLSWSLDGWTPNKLKTRNSVQLKYKWMGMGFYWFGLRPYRNGRQSTLFRFFFLFTFSSGDMVICDWPPVTSWQPTRRRTSCSIHLNLPPFFSFYRISWKNFYIQFPISIGFFIFFLILLFFIPVLRSMSDHKPQIRSCRDCRPTCCPSAYCLSVKEEKEMVYSSFQTARLANT